jgi:hypothetical protein
MAPEKQILTDRQNAAPATAAVPPGGRSRAARDALKTGLRARFKNMSPRARRLDGEGEVPPECEPDLILRAMGYLSRTFARLPCGERRECIGALRERIAELEQAPSRGGELSPRSNRSRL